jgi:hypothetical protein
VEQASNDMKINVAAAGRRFRVMVKRSSSKYPAIDSSANADSQSALGVPRQAAIRAVCPDGGDDGATTLAAIVRHRASSRDGLP